MRALTADDEVAAETAAASRWKGERCMYTGRLETRTALHTNI